MFISQLRTVDDLEDGGLAEPEPGVRYALRTIHNRLIDSGTVTAVVRVGDTLQAITDAGESFSVSGVGAPILVPINP